VVKITRARDLASATPGSTGIPFRMTAGIATTSAANGRVTIVFPASRFTTTPTITASGVSGGIFALYSEIVSVDANGAVIGVNADGSQYPNLIARTLHYQAIQMTSGSASG
jgi:hypothetical protein